MYSRSQALKIYIQTIKQKTESTSTQKTTTIRHKAKSLVKATKSS